jgi:TRAP-type C4-dicarboxylate transport system permease large subunit
MTLPAPAVFPPILMPLLKALNVDMVYFGILISVNTMIGLTTPPVGVCLFGVSAIAKLPMEKIVRAYVPFLAILVGRFFAEPGSGLTHELLCNRSQTGT